jgi:hypothetical protein
MTRAKVYFIMESEDYDNYGFAFSPENISPKEIQNWDETKPWLPIIFELSDGKFADYLVNDLNIPLCSSKLKQTIQNNIANNYSILWHPVFVNFNNKSTEYYYLKLKKIIVDVIDIDKSEKENNTIFNPYFIAEKTEDIFRCDFDLSYLFISENLKNIIEKEGVTGIGFETWD